MRAIHTGYAIVLIAALLGGLATGLRLYYILFITLATMYLLCVGMNLWTFISFSYTQKLAADQGTRGESISLEVGVYNDKLFPFTHMAVHVQGVEKGVDRTVRVELMPRESMTETLPLPLTCRGVYEVGMTILEVTDCFGLCAMRFDLRRLTYYRTKKITVLPAAEELPLLPPARGDARELPGARALDDGESFAFVRAYRPGDSLKRVHWKRSAGRGQLFLKQYDRPEEPAVTLLLDDRTVACEDPAQKAALEDALCSVAVTLIRQALRSRRVARLISLTHGEVIPVRGGSEYEALRWHLAAFAFDAPKDAPSTLAKAAALLQNGAAYLVSTDASEAIEQSFSTATAGKGMLVLVHGQQPAPKQSEKPRRLPLLCVKDARDLSDLLSGEGGAL